MLSNNLLRILRPHMAVPDSLRVNHQHRTMFALVQATSLVDANHPIQARSLSEFLQLRNQLARTIRSTGRARRALRTNVLADKNMPFK